MACGETRCTVLSTANCITASSHMTTDHCDILSFPWTATCDGHEHFTAFPGQQVYRTQDAQTVIENAGAAGDDLRCVAELRRGEAGPSGENRPEDPGRLAAGRCQPGYARCTLLVIQAAWLCAQTICGTFPCLASYRISRCNTWPTTGIRRGVSHCPVAVSCRLGRRGRNDMHVACDGCVDVTPGCAALRPFLTANLYLFNGDYIQVTKFRNIAYSNRLSTYFALQDSICSSEILLKCFK